MTVDDIWREIQHEANGCLNRYYAFLEIGHSPDAVEATLHFIEHGGEEYVMNKLKQKEQCETT